MKPALKWTLITLSALLALCLLSPLVLARQLTEADFESDGYTDVAITRRGLLTFGFEGRDRRGQLCSGVVRRGYLSSSRDSFCQNLRTDEVILREWADELMGKVKLPFGAIRCGPIEKGAPTATCEVSPEKAGSTLTFSFARTNEEWTVTGPSSAWQREDIADDIRKKLVKKGHAIEALDCGGTGLLGPSLGDTLECTIRVANDATAHSATVTFEAKNYVWRSDL